METNKEQLRFGIHTGAIYNSFEDCLAIWQKAEHLGFQWGSVFDHFRPPDFPEGPCFEGSTLLSALAAKTEEIRCAMLVFCISNRHPAMVANIAATLDNISGGRLELGLGAGAPDLAQEQYSFPFPAIKQRMEMLDEYCLILDKLLYQEKTDFQGKYYQLYRAQLNPKPLQNKIPIIIGGAGEKYTLQIAAKHADIWNSFTAGDMEQYKHKLNVLSQHCSNYNKDFIKIRKSILFKAIIFNDKDEIEERRNKIYGGASLEELKSRGFLVVGTPEQCIEQLQAYASMGVNDFLLGIKTPADYKTMELFSQEVVPELSETVYN